MALLEVKNLKMYFQTMRGDVRAVDGVTFDVRKRDSLGLAGESGCGKTSVALSILRLLPWNGKIVDGSIEFDGVDLVKMSQDKLRDQIRWKRISVVFQGAMNALHPTKTVGTQIAEAIVAHEKSVDKEQAKKRGERLLDLVGVGAQRFNRYPHELSGGMKQRVMTAMSLACNPELVIADEPTTALDVIVEAQVLKALKELQQKLDLSLILISHDLSMIAETCNRIAIMYAGKIVEQGDTVSIFKESLHPYTQLLLGAFPSIIGEKKELTSIHGFPPDLLNPPSGCRFHPRCPYAWDVCKKQEPKLVQTDENRFVACHKYKA